MSTFRVADRKRFTTLTRETLNDDRLSFRARGVLVWLLDKPDNWRCSGREITKAGREGRDAIFSALKELEDLGYLRRERFQDARGQWETIVNVYETPPSPGEPSPGKPSPGKPAFGKPGPITKTETDDCNRTPIVPNGAVPSEVVDDRFERFWKQYPRPVGKPRAEQVFKRLMKTVTLEEILIGLQPWVRYWEQKGQPEFIPHPSTFLNDRRWENEPPINGHQLSPGGAALKRMLEES